MTRSWHLNRQTPSIWNLWNSKPFFSSAIWSSPQVRLQDAPDVGVNSLSSNDHDIRVLNEVKNGTAPKGTIDTPHSRQGGRGRPKTTGTRLLL